MSDHRAPQRGARWWSRAFYWPRNFSLTTRILAVNLIAIGLLAGSFFYLDSYRKQLLEERFKLANAEGRIAADAMADMDARQRRAFAVQVGAARQMRVRLFDAAGRLELDSFALAPPSFALINPADETRLQTAARWLDRAVDFIVGAREVPQYTEPARPDAQGWPEIAASRGEGVAKVYFRYAPDRTPVITAAIPVGSNGETLLTLRNAPDITQAVRDARQTLAIIVAVALLFSIQLSLFLARTIVQPLRSLVRAAVRVRLGRDRAVVVPRLPERGDEIGMLARAFSDMAAALRQRIDAVESFAADVAHELKNPLASLRGAIDTLDKVEDPTLREQLVGIAAHDVQRLDRLITEIADASRIDAELSRATFERIDLASLAARLVGARGVRVAADRTPRVRFRRGPGEAVVSGDAARLERVLENLVDNAVSFSPPGGEVEVTVSGDESGVRLAVSDEGPGIPAAEREKVFERFHSVRPPGEAFGAHSGLGPAIARTIANAHDGRLVIADRADGRAGACLVLMLPAAGGKEVR